MALSTLRVAMRMRPCLLAQKAIFTRQVVPMASSAHDQMKAFWEKNQRLQRPVAPWIVYKWEFPMFTSLTHRTTGIIMGVALYGIGMGLLAAPDNFEHYIQIVKAWELGPYVWFPLKSIVAFPLVYHYFNGIRHLWWDYKGGYEIKTQYKSGTFVYSLAILTSGFLASLSYWAF